jgi:phosphoserine aminotransferase
MKPIYFTVGPSELYPKFGRFLDAAMKEGMGSISHRSQRFAELHKDLGMNLKRLIGVPETYHVFYSGSATEWMERILQNCSAMRTLHFVNGAFSKRFYEIAKTLGRETVSVGCRPDQPFIIQDIPSDVAPELVCLTHNETSNGTMLPKTLIREVRERFPGAIIALDIVSSAPTCDLDFSLIDCAFFSVQKGFGLPAGLGVLFVSPHAVEVSQMIGKSQGAYTGSYHSFASLWEYEKKNQTPETPNVLGMYLLSEVARDMLIIGKETMYREMLAKAALLYDAISRSSMVAPCVADSAIRSQTVLVANAKAGSKEIIQACKARGFILAGGYGIHKEDQIRIGNFPSHAMADVVTLASLLMAGS